MDTGRRIKAVTVTSALVLLLASCATVNQLSRHDFYGASLSASMRTPPAPRLDVRYDVTLDKRNPVYSALSVMSNLAKASQAEKTQQLMRDALLTVDVPGVILEQSLAACATTLGANPEDRGTQSDYLLALDIREWGIEADSPATAVVLRIRVSARMYHNIDRELVWERTTTVNQPASPVMFGLGQIADNIVTMTVLSNMTEQDLADGFRQLAREAARSISRQLENDLYSARYGG